MELFIRGVLGLTFAVALILLFSIPSWLLWNGIVPKLFGGPEISLLQAVGLSLLARLLLGTGVAPATTKTK